MTQVLDDPATRTPGRPETVARRLDIDGLRALAIALVVVYHVWSLRVSGGVDVFLMISAYFLTASFLRKAEGGRPLRLGGYWLGRFRRLLPAAAVTIIGTLGLIWMWFPRSTWSDLLEQAWASLFYVENWALAAAEVDYYARDLVLPSPFQHFWSLSVQGQVFLAWPLLIVVALGVARLLRVRPRPALIAVFSVVFAASLAYSIHITAENQAFAYFDTGARLWEFAIGSLLALLTPWLRLPRVLAAVVGWLGIAALIACGLLLDVRAGFPGYLALWPTLAAAAVIIAGEGDTRGGPARLLSAWPFQRLGTIAYALYLVHWPILITYLLLFDPPSVTLGAGATVIGLSLVLAIVITYGIEQPLQRWQPLSRNTPALALVVVLIGLTTVPLTIWQRVEAQTVAEAARQVPNPGAAILFDPLIVEPDDAVPLLPDAGSLDAEWVWYDECPADALASVLVETCSHRAAEQPSRSVLVIGDSHAQQWGGALTPIAEEEGWELTTLLRGGCAFAADEPAPWADDCDEWRAAAAAYAVEAKPDLIVLMGTKTVPESPDERALQGLDVSIRDLSAAGAPLVLLRDNPRFAENIFACVELGGPDAAECSRDRSAVLAARNPADVFEGDDVHVVDLTDYLCPDLTCPPVIGGVVIYIDHDHITRTYAESLAPILREALQHALRW
ncbi:acyltransferase family protein [Microbacterium sp. No. 7]|uniref:acyltransferase family protein n=1 Tax=Microbacterium sp. No. 7 TaxID=1714373 RepID=UPI0006D277B0|nr:acyltransferase family protein [Microbacterium sp. No. 7]ALJ19397.1 hypothetical protein AOA12_05550 [Microbacterium sp. No. 7]